MWPFYIHETFSCIFLIHVLRCLIIITAKNKEVFKDSGHNTRKNQVTLYGLEGVLNPLTAIIMDFTSINTFQE